MTRISELQRRDWRARVKPFIGPLSSALRTDPAAQLRPVQAAALLELAEVGGVFVNGRVGIGKTLVTALAARMIPNTRVLILMPGGDVLRDTTTAFAELRKQWRLPPADMMLRSYNFISNLPRKGERIADLFGDGVGPTMIVCDEADKLRNIRTAACTRQIAEYLQTHPQTVFAVVTGTCDVEGILDYAHLLDWCLRDRSPLPSDPAGVEDWSSVLDQGDMRKAQWICQDLAIPEDSDLAAIRAAYKQRLVETPGVIVEDSPFDDVPLTVAEHVIDPGCTKHFERLRDFGQRPDGADLEIGGSDELTSIWPVARRMARGLCYTWAVPPPEEWRKARSRYFSWVRNSQHLTERVARDWAETNDELAWVRWKGVKDSYEPQVITQWLSNAALEFCAEWGRQPGGGIIWVDNPPFGARLAELTGWVHYPSGGKLDIKKAPADSVVIASRRAHGTAKNLQFQWNRMLFTAPPNSSRDFEQNVGRLHREGQTRPVHVDILLACREDFGSIAKVLRGAKRTAESLYAQKAMSVVWKHPRRLTGPAFER